MANSSNIPGSWPRVQLEELQENITDAYLSAVLTDVPDEYQTKTIQCDIPTRPTTQTAGVSDLIRSAPAT